MRFLLIFSAAILSIGVSRIGSGEQSWDSCVDPDVDVFAQATGTEQQPPSFLIGLENHGDCSVFLIPPFSPGGGAGFWKNPVVSAQIRDSKGKSVPTRLRPDALRHSTTVKSSINDYVQLPSNHLLAYRFSLCEVWEIDMTEPGDYAVRFKVTFPDPQLREKGTGDLLTRRMEWEPFIIQGVFITGELQFTVDNDALLECTPATQTMPGTKKSGRQQGR